MSSVPGLVPYSTSVPIVSLLVEKMRYQRVKQAVVTSARLFVENVKMHRVCMVTLTYRPGAVWSPKDITGFIRAARKYVQRRGSAVMRYVWVAEVQEQRAAANLSDIVLHYHVLLWLPKGLTLPKPDKQGWWSRGSTRIEWARRPIRYVLKYVSKIGAFDRVPKGARVVGVGGLNDLERAERAWWRCPRWLRDETVIEDRPNRARGGGWVKRKTGEWLDSRYTFAGLACGGLVVMLIEKGVAL
ncbi:MAG: hypothetical protein C3F12_00145 [Candidatus Methylomirabilota bacterium]|nr:MAG: hypothetical protein C3F12_00145 [candidate division NC10 bacterium]